MASKDLIKRLSHSSEQHIRDQAVDELEALIKDQGIAFEDMELRKLFEGIFFCFWHSDKPKYQQSLTRKFVNYTNLIEKEEDKVMWVQYFFKCLCLHWDRLDHWRMNKYLLLIKSQLVVIFEHLKSIWDSKPECIQQYMDTIYQESLKEKEVPLGVGMQMADVYIDEMAACFDKSSLSHKRVRDLLNPFLQALSKIDQIVLFRRIKDKVFLKLIESNGLDAEEENPLYFPKFDIVEYAEVDLFTVASAQETLESRRDEIWVSELILHLANLRGSIW